VAATAAVILTSACASTSSAARLATPNDSMSAREVKSGQAPTQVSIGQNIVAACGLSKADAYFSFDSSKLNVADRSPLDEVAACFTRGPLAHRQLDLVGRADPRGASEYNMSLGQARADAVEGYLVGLGVSRSHASATTRGALDASGTDEASWARDRRVDLLLAN
jgi:peptidoglycan-associated lipoprotein